MSENTSKLKQHETTLSELVAQQHSVAAAIEALTQATSPLEITLVDYARQAHKINSALTINPLMANLGKSEISTAPWLQQMTKAAVLPVHSSGVLASLFESTKALRTNPFAGQAIESVRAWQSIAAAINPLRDIRRNADITQFILPTNSDIYSLSKILTDTVSAASHLKGIQAAMAGMTQPWLDTKNKIGSVVAFAQLHSIGQKLKSYDPYGKAITTMLRPALGDWRKKVEFTPQEIENPEARLEAYDKLGVDPKLTEFPEEAFDEILVKAGIIPSGDPFKGPTDPAQRVGENITNKAHLFILRFERSLRTFIDQKMIEQFGTNWTKGRLPNKMHDDWKGRKEKYVKEKPEDNDIPIIDFADFTDYERIITKADNWKEVFSKFFKREESIRESFQRLHPARLNTMHSRLITPTDYLLLFAELKRMSIILER